MSSEPIKISSVLQLSPHGETTIIGNEETPEEGECISLDDVYEITGQESLRVLAANCIQYLNYGKLAKSAFTTLRISGFESATPFYDKYNAHMGAESWLTKLKDGFITIVKMAKRFLDMILDYVVNKIKSIFGFGKTEKELAIVAEVSNDVKAELGNVLGKMAGVEKVNFNVKELYEALPNSVTTSEAFTIIQDKNKTTKEQLETIEKIQKEMEEAEQLIIKASQTARTTKSRYGNACKALKKAYESKDLSIADIMEFRNFMDTELVTNLNSNDLRDKLASILDKLYGIDLGSVGADTGFKETIKAQRDKITAVTSVTVTPDEYELYQKFSKKYQTSLVRAAKDKFLEGELTFLKDVILVQDAQLIDNIARLFPEAGVLIPSYTAYSSAITEFASNLDTLVTVIGQVKRTTAGVVNWSNKVDKLMLGYISNDLSKILRAEQENLPQSEVDRLAVVNSKGERTDTIMNIDYDALFMCKHEKLAPFVIVGRDVASRIKSEYKMINTINGHLKQLGIKGIS